MVGHFACDQKGINIPFFILIHHPPDIIIIMIERIISRIVKNYVLRFVSMQLLIKMLLLNELKLIVRKIRNVFEQRNQSVLCANAADHGAKAMVSHVMTEQKNIKTG